MYRGLTSGAKFRKFQNFPEQLLLYIEHDYVTSYIQPFGAGMCPICMPVSVSYSFLSTGPIPFSQAEKRMSLPWSYMLHTGEITAAVPHRPHSANDASSLLSILRSSTGMCRIFSAMYTSERRVIDGRIVSDFGVTILPSCVMNRTFAPPVSSINVCVAGSR